MPNISSNSSVDVLEIGDDEPRSGSSGSSASSSSANSNSAAVVGVAGLSLGRKRRPRVESDVQKFVADSWRYHSVHEEFGQCA